MVYSRFTNKAVSNNSRTTDAKMMSTAITIFIVVNL
jgi:hypothetical protein